MKVVTGVAEMAEMRRGMHTAPGLIPTMGYLHEGHISLIRQARSRHETVIVSIFVNPAQFEASEDFGSYPRDLNRDVIILENEGVDIVFAPTAEDMYPQGFDAWVEVLGLSSSLEGACRPGHFRGVATVVLKLVNITRPEAVYFGQKDAQQVLIIQKMVMDLNLGIDIQVMPIVRQSDGLALSSRNSYLSAEERQAATALAKALDLARTLFNTGNRNSTEIKAAMANLLDSEPLLATEYISIASTLGLQEMDAVQSPALISLAVRTGKTRLIDNIIV